MFKFLKEKLKGAISKISKKVEEEKPIEEKPIETEEKQKGQSTQEKTQKTEDIEEDQGKDEASFGDMSLDEELEDLEKIGVAARTEKGQTTSYEPIPDEFEDKLFDEDETEQEDKSQESAKANLEIVDTPHEEKKQEDELKLTEQDSEELQKKDRIETENIPEKPVEEKKKRGFLGFFRRKDAAEGKLPPKDKVEKKTQDQFYGEKKGFIGKFAEKITTTKISREKFEDLFSELEIILMENNVAMEVIDKIKNDLSSNLVEKPIKRTRVEETIKESLRNSIEDLFKVEEVKLFDSIKRKEEKPFVIAFFGINGSGKTTSIAKVASMLKQKKFSVVLAAADTFRAASIEQLQQHADKLGVKMIKHDYGSDPAAVAFDAIKHAKAKNADVVLIDTAGRLHSQKNLMQEMEKIIRVKRLKKKIKKRS